MEALLAKASGKSTKAKSEDKHLQLTHVVPQGEAVQIYDAFTGSFRVVVGPDIAKLGPSEVLNRIWRKGRWGEGRQKKGEEILRY